MDNASFFRSIISMISELHDDPRAVDVLRDPLAGSEIDLFDAGLLRSVSVVRLL